MYIKPEIKQLIIDEYESFKNKMYAESPEEIRTKLGQFFTPADVSLQMLELLETDSLSGREIIDPTSGSGNLLAAALIAGADSDKVFGNEYDQRMVNACKERLNKVCDILGKPHIKDWQIHQGNALHKFALTYFDEDYEEMYYDGCTQNAARKRKLEDSSYDAYTMSTRFKQKYPELYKEALSLNLKTTQKKQAEATGSFDLFSELF